MPNGYGGYRGGYGGGGRSNFQYDARQPAAFQYQSFFDPIPLEFLQEQGERRQQKYDVAYAGALSQQDQLAQTLVSTLDIAGKESVIGKGVDEINKIVDKYGGDWGRAAKDVAAKVTELRSDPFWNTQIKREEQRKAYGESIVQAGTRGMQFGPDPRLASTLDEEGNLRGEEAFAGRVVEAGDWNQTARELIGNLTPDKYQEYGLTAAKVAGYLRTGEITGISVQRIADLAADPDVQKSFLQEHPEFREGFENLDPAQKQKFGLDAPSLGEAVRSTLFGATKQQAFTQRDVDYKADIVGNEMLKNSLKGTTGGDYIHSSTYAPFTPGNTDLIRGHEKMMSGKVGSNRRVQGLSMQDPTTGVHLTMQVELTDATASFNNGIITAEELNDRRDKITEKYRELSLALPEGMTREEATEANKQEYYESLQEKFPELNEVNPDTGKSYTIEEGFELVGSYYQSLSEDRKLLQNLVLDNTETNLKETLFQNINSGDFRAMGFTDKATGDVFDRNSIAEKLGYKNYLELETALQGEGVKLNPKLDFNEGNITVTTPSNPKKARRVQPVELSFNVDEQTRSMINTGKNLQDDYMNPYNHDETSLTAENFHPQYDWKGNPTGKAYYVTGSGGLRGNNKQVWLATFGTDPQGNTIIVDRKQTSLEGAHKDITKQVDLRFNNIRGKTGNTGLIVNPG